MTHRLGIWYAVPTVPVPERAKYHYQIDDVRVKVDRKSELSGYDWTSTFMSGGSDNGTPYRLGGFSPDEILYRDEDDGEWTIVPALRLYRPPFHDCVREAGAKWAFSILRTRTGPISHKIITHLAVRDGSLVPVLEGLMAVHRYDD